MAEGFRLIAAADRGWAIGKNGRMLVQIPKERQLFLAETRGAAVVMGRKTFDALPGGSPCTTGRTSSFPESRDLPPGACGSSGALKKPLPFFRHFHRKRCLLSAARVFSGSSCPGARLRTSPPWITGMTGTVFFPPWTGILHGSFLRKAKTRPAQRVILISAERSYRLMKRQ